MQGQMVDDGLQSSWLELLICAAGFVAAFSGMPCYLHPLCMQQCADLHSRHGSRVSTLHDSMPACKAGLCSMHMHMLSGM